MTDKKPPGRPEGTGKYTGKTTIRSFRLLDNKKFIEEIRNHIKERMDFHRKPKK